MFILFFCCLNVDVGSGFNFFQTFRSVEAAQTRVCSQHAAQLFNNSVLSVLNLS